MNRRQLAKALPFIPAGIAASLQQADDDKKIVNGVKKLRFNFEVGFREVSFGTMDCLDEEGKVLASHTMPGMTKYLMDGDTLHVTVDLA